MGTSDSGRLVGSYPVHNEDLADVEFVLELLGGYGHRVEETEAPVDKQTGRKAATCVYQDIFNKLISYKHHMDPRNLLRLVSSYLASCVDYSVQAVTVPTPLCNSE